MLGDGGRTSPVRIVIYTCHPTTRACRSVNNSNTVSESSGLVRKECGISSRSLHDFSSNSTLQSNLSSNNLPFRWLEIYLARETLCAAKRSTPQTTVTPNIFLVTFDAAETAAKVRSITCRSSERRSNRTHSSSDTT